MLDIILFVLFSVMNSRLAKKKGLNPTSWVLRTIGAMIAGIFLGAFIFLITYQGSRDFQSVQNFMLHNPLKMLNIYALEIGGGLLVRYLIERTPASGDNSPSD